MKLGLGTLLITTSLLTVGTSWASTPLPPGLFQAATPERAIRPPDKALPGQTRVVRVNRGQLRSSRLYLNLGIAPGMTAELERLVDDGNESVTWIGKVAGDSESGVAFAAGKDSVAGTVRFHGRLFKLLPVGKGLHVLSEVPPGDPYPEMDPIPVAEADLAAPAAEDSTLAAADDGTTVDVLVAYTTASKNRYGGDSGIQSLINLAIAETNQAYLNSGIAMRLRLAGTTEVNYTESGAMDADLNRLTDPDDDFMDEIHALRDELKADTVTLIEESSDYCGIAWLMTDLSVEFQSNAFSVVYSSCATGYYSFGHELGHNMGAHHDHASAGTALTAYSYGWQDPGALFRTVMAYNCSGGCTRVQYFSNPDVSYGGAPTGQAGYADNARSLNEAAYTVANWRGSASLLPPDGPTDLKAVAGGTDRII